MKKLIALILAALLLAGVLVACGESGGNSGGDTTSKSDTATKDQSGDSGNSGNTDPLRGENNVSLVVWAPSNAVPLTKEMCKEFTDQFADKKISIEVKPMEEGDCKGQILNDPSAAADVFSFAVDQLTDLNRAKALSAVTFYGNDATIKERDSEASVNAATLNGLLLGYPETGENGYYLVYDKAVVSDEDAKTFEGVLEACRKAGVKFNMDAGNGFYACMFLFTGGLKLTGIEDEVQQFNDYDEEKVLDVLQAFNKLFNDYKDVFQSQNVDSTSAGLATNPKTIGAGIDGSWNATTVSGYLGDNYGAVKLPTIHVKYSDGTEEDTQIISMNGYKLIGVNNYTKYPNTAHQLAMFLTNEACQMKRAEQLSWSPSNKNVAASDIVSSNLGTVACLDQANYSEPQVNIANTFWSPTGNLGNYIVKNGVVSRDDLKAEFEKTIKNIKDE